MIAMIFAFRKIFPSFATTNILHGSCGGRDFLERGGASKYFEEFCSLIKLHITETRLTWIPGRVGTIKNEMADT